MVSTKLNRYKSLPNVSHQGGCIAIKRALDEIVKFTKINNSSSLSILLGFTFRDTLPEGVIKDNIAVSVAVACLERGTRHDVYSLHKHDEFSLPVLQERLNFSLFYFSLLSSLLFSCFLGFCFLVVVVVVVMLLLLALRM